MKKLLLLLMLLPITAFPQTVEVFAPHMATVAHGKTCLPIWMFRAHGLLSFQFDMDYDPNVLRPYGANFGCSTTGIASNMIVVCNEQPVGTLRVAVYGTDYFSGTGNALNLMFIGQPGDTTLHFRNAFVNEGDPESIWYDGAVVVN